MSVLSVPSPVLGKRHFDEGEAGESFDRQLSGKRTRQHFSPASARLVQFAAGGLHAVPSSTLSALLALFPGMDERTVSNVLSECGNNIDAAIRRLGELRLSGLEVASAGGAAQASASATPAGTPSVLGTTASSGTAEAAAADPASLSAGGRAGTSTTTAAAGLTTAEQWVDLLVTEMSAATDMADARQRAAGFLSQFEVFVTRYVRQQQASCSGEGASPEGSAGIAARASKLAEENTVLKKAVQIQHRQLQERAAQDSEVAQLKVLLAQYQEQVRTLQVSNYSLTLHLHKATNSDSWGQPRNPDVF